MDHRNPNLQLINVIPKVKIASYLIQGQDTGLTFLNTGATGSVTWTAPLAHPGKWFEVLITAAHTVTVTPKVATDTIRGQSAGASVSSSTVGTYWCFRCLETGFWEQIVYAT